jgi:murein DD-endopeptidase MepM/ murein hydrolase activator NlpD
MEAKIRRTAAALALTLLTLLGAAAARADREPRLAGVHAAAADLDERWPWSGAWVYPVGDPLAYDRPDSADREGYRLLRGIRPTKTRATRHQGVDWGNRAAGGIVRAAAHGVVVRAVAPYDGAYGDHVVLAHRLPEGDWAFSIYAHLQPGTITVSEGDVIAAAAPLARVGRTGNASTPHLHFEVRRTADPLARWEHAPAIDPVAFVADRLPAAPDSSWARPYLEWAELSALIARDAAAEGPLTRSTWWSMLARAARHSLRDLPGDIALVQDLLRELGVLSRAATADGIVEWSEMRRDLKRLASVGTRLPAAPAADRRDRPRRGDARPTLADACAELAGAVEDSE